MLLVKQLLLFNSTILLSQDNVDIVIRQTLNDIINQVVKLEQEADNTKVVLNRTWMCIDKINECKISSPNTKVNKNIYFFV